MPIRKKSKIKKKIRMPDRSVLWKGPAEDGITFSLLSRYLCCRERFRIMTVEGLGPPDSFNHRIEYGSMWHECEEAEARGDRWEQALMDYSRILARRYPLSQEQVTHWYNVCRTQFPLYARYWSGHPGMKDRTPVMQEHSFSVPYLLPSGRTVRLRGKWDSVDRVGKTGVWLQENKTKGEVDDQLIGKQLRFDLQTMIYLTALHTELRSDDPSTGLQEIVGKGARIKGVRYNVIRRPLSGGKGSIKPLKNANAGKKGPDGKPLPKRPETMAEYYERLGGIIGEDPGYFFMRWNVEVAVDHVASFAAECLNPVLESLCDWWDWVKDPGKDPWRDGGSGVHYRFPYGVYNPLIERGSTDLDMYLDTGSRTGLQRIESLFPEL